jgi:hypothetical protein
VPVCPDLDPAFWDGPFRRTGLFARIQYLSEMAGETDLTAMLASMRIERRPLPVTVVHLPGSVGLGDGVFAEITEKEGTTAVVSIAEAERRGWPVEFEAAWLTVSVHSSLDAVGLTAALANALADRGIACNVLAAYFHDHLLVPLDRVDEAIECLEGLAD